ERLKRHKSRLPKSYRRGDLLDFGNRYSVIANSLSLNNRQAPMGAYFSPWVDITILVSLLTIDSEYLLIEFFRGRLKYSSDLANTPPMMISSGLKILIRAASPRPNFSPISLMASMHRVSSLFAALMISFRRMSSMVLNFLVRILVAPVSIASIILFRSAWPEASVSRQPFLPHLQIISLSNMGIWPNSPEN